MITVAGGTYRERCREPQWNELYGSGFRAACVIASLGDKVELQTAVDDAQRPLLNQMAAPLGIRVSAMSIPRTIGFFYQHGMAAPEIEPDPRRIDLGVVSHNLSVRSKNVLCFGFIEGSVVVTGDSVVYDPQSPTCPNPFRARSCTADRLVVIANRSELRQLSGESNVLRSAQKVLKTEAADAVIVKMGPEGCLVVTRHGNTAVPAFRTKKVFPIGSGDAFSAAFAFAWMSQGQSVVAAARFASKSAAYFCERRTFPTADFGGWKPKPLTVLPKDRHKTVYLAGPFFNASQRWLIDELWQSLRQVGLKVFSPLHDVGPGPAETIWKLDIKGLHRSGVVLAVLDGLDPGTLYEVGYAHAQKKPVIGLASSEREEDLKMCRGGGCLMVDDIPTAVYQVCWAATCK